MTLTTIMLDLDAVARQARISLDSAKARLMAIRDEGINRLDSYALVVEAQAGCQAVLAGLPSTDIHNRDRFESLSREATKLVTLYRIELEVHVKAASERANGSQPHVSIVEPSQTPARPAPYGKPAPANTDKVHERREYQRRYAREVAEGKRIPNSGQRRETVGADGIRRVYLGTAEIKEIREYLDKTCGADCGWPAIEEVAAAYGVGKTTIWNIYKRVTFKDL